MEDKFELKEEETQNISGGAKSRDHYFYVKYNSNRYAIDYAWQAPVGTIKNKLQQLSHMPVREQDLRFKGVELADNNKFIGHYGVEENDELTLEHRFVD